MMGTADLSAGATQIPPHTACWFRVGGVPAEPTAGQVKNIESYGRTPEPVSHGKRVSNWLLKRGRRMQTKEKEAGRCKRPTAQNPTLSPESRWPGHFIQFVWRDQESTRIERSL